MRVGSVCLAGLCAVMLATGADLFAQQPAAVQVPAGQGGGQGAGARQGGGGGGQGGGGRGRGAAPQTPAPRNAQGRAILGGKGVWTPSGFGITTPLLATEKT